MPFYENFSMKKPTSLGIKMANREASNVLRKIIGYKPDIHSVLEIGPGRGPFAIASQANGLDYFSTDISWVSLQNLPSVTRKVQSLVPPVPFADQSFDLTFASNVLEHMLDFKHALSLVQEMKRVTRPGGLVCHRVPNSMAWGLHFWNGDYTHSFFTTPRTVSQVYQDTGLGIRVIYPVSAFVVGSLAVPLSFLAHFIPSWLFNHGGSRTAFSQSIYSAKTTLYLGFLIIGQREENVNGQ